MTDNIARLREAWEKTTPGEWPRGTRVFDGPFNEGCDCDGCEELRRDRGFAILAHNEFGKILAVLAAASVLTHDGSDNGIIHEFCRLRDALSALKGGTE